MALEFLRDNADFEFVLAKDRIAEIDALANLIGEGRSVLEIAYGQSRMTGPLRILRCDVTALQVSDLDTLAIEQLSKRTKFDVVCLSGVLERVSQPLGFLEHCRTLLHPSGFIVASVTNAAYGPFRLALLTGTFDTLSAESHSAPVHLLNKTSIERLFGDAGFSLSELHRCCQRWGDVAGVLRPEIDETLLRQLERDEESSTLTFVVKAIPARPAANDTRDHERDIHLLKQEALALRALLVERDVENAELRAAARMLREKAADLRGALKTSQRDREEAVRALELARKEAQDARAKLSVLTMDLSRSREETDEKSREAAEMEGFAGALLSELESAAADRDALQARVHTADGLVSNLSQKLAAATAERDKAQAALAAYERRAQDAERMLLDQTNALIETTKTEIARLSDMIEVVQNSRFWRVKRFISKLFGRSGA